MCRRSPTASAIGAPVAAPVVDTTDASVEAGAGAVGSADDSSGTGAFAAEVILNERFQSSNHMGCPKRPHSVDGKPKNQLSGFMESVV
jgi:hypothetical protein